MPATPARTTTRYRAAWTMFLVVTTRMAATAMDAARNPKATFWATSRWAAASRLGTGRCRLLVLGALLDLRPGLQGQGLGHRLHPVAQPLLVVEQLGDAHLRVLVLRAPEQGVEGTDLHADAAVHAQPVVDVETVQELDGAGLAALTPGRGLVLVALYVDAPVRTAPGAQHAHGAVLLLQGDDAPGPGGRSLFLVGVLHRDRGPQHGPQGHAQALDQTGKLCHSVHHLQTARDQAL